MERWDARRWVLTLSLEPLSAFKESAWKSQSVLSGKLRLFHLILHSLPKISLDSSLSRNMRKKVMDADPTFLKVQCYEHPGSLQSNWWWKFLFQRISKEIFFLLFSETRKVWETSQVTRDNYLIINLGTFLCSKHWQEQLVSSLPAFPLLFPIH